MINRLSPRQETGSKWLTATLVSIYIIIVLLLAIQRSDADTRNSKNGKSQYSQAMLNKSQVKAEIHTQTVYTND